MPAGVKRTAAWRVIRGVKRSVLAPRSDDVLPAEQCRSAVRFLNPPAALEAGASWPARYRLDNRSGVAWTSRGRSPVRLRCRWLTYRGEPFDAGQCLPLPRPV
jgi:hypothetical protein